MARLFAGADLVSVMPAAEIGDQIVSILERRLAAMRAQLQKLGEEYQWGSR